MKLFVGLGNPGGAYARHRHNVGFMAVERIAERHGLTPWRKRFRGLCCEGTIARHRVVVLKPQTYMNESGRAVGEALRYLNIGPGDVYAFHDDLDLAPGKLKAKVGGGNAGHNGLRSLSQHIGNEYGRVRIGIGHPGSKDLVQAYVLHDFPRSDAAWLDPLLAAVAAAADRLADGDEARFLTDVALALRAREVSSAPRTRSERETPAEERQPRRMGALADNLKKWLKRR